MTYELWMILFNKWSGNLSLIAFYEAPNEDMKVHRWWLWPKSHCPFPNMPCAYAANRGELSPSTIFFLSFLPPYLNRIGILCLENLSLVSKSKALVSYISIT